MKVSRCEMWFIGLLLLFRVSKSQELDDSEGGDFLFFSNNDEFAGEGHFLGKGSKGSKLDCTEAELSSYLASLQIINPESLIALATKNKLQNKCHNISKTINNMESYLTSCNVQPGQEQYLSLLNGVKALHNKLCNDNQYRKSFMEHIKCYGEMQNKLGDSCSGPADWCDGSDSSVVCRAYKEIRDCYYLQASILCGEKAAATLQSLVQCIIESIITVNCTINITEEDLSKMSKEQRLMLKKGKLDQSKSEHVDSGSPQHLLVSWALQLLCIVILTFLPKLKEFLI